MNHLTISATRKKNGWKASSISVKRQKSDEITGAVVLGIKFDMMNEHYQWWKPGCYYRTLDEYKNEVFRLEDCELQKASFSTKLKKYNDFWGQQEKQKCFLLVWRLIQYSWLRITNLRFSKVAWILVANLSMPSEITF